MSADTQWQKSAQTFAEFEAQALALGFDAAVERTWPADTILDTHTHAFAASAIVTAGEMWLTVGDDTQHVKVGQTFSLAAEIPHREKYGAAGATYWVARKNVT